jgi:hypothetical protein
MQHRSKHLWEADSTTTLLVCSHRDSVSFYSGSSASDGSDWSIRLRPCHLSVVRKLVEALEALDEQTDKAVA